MEWSVCHEEARQLLAETSDAEMPTHADVFEPFHQIGALSWMDDRLWTSAERQFHQKLSWIERDLEQNLEKRLRHRTGRRGGLM